MYDYSNEEIVNFEDLGKPTFGKISQDLVQTYLLTIDEAMRLHMEIFVADV